jgi:hypothetical protein
MKILTLAALAAFSALAQTQVAKPEPAAAKVEVAMPAPKLDSTAKLWRLAAKAESIQAQMDKSELGKSLAETNAQLQAEQSRLAAQCGTGWMLGVEQDQKAANANDLICQKVPDPPKTDSKPEAAKGK